ncbi:MAG TPA: hypothetical protein DCP31_03830 [Cyanobacteria bacterium UBA8543]|nr:hypothetical protein [Cyanobacteria bacterium UBA8543]
MKIGSEAHKELFCRHFMESHLNYEPEKLSWPQLDGVGLERLRGIPFWEKALDTEREAGSLVSAYAQTVSDPVLREAIALQGVEEARHARLIDTLIKQYGIEITVRPNVELPSNLEQAITTFGFEECLDSFFAFGLFDIARQANFLPEPFFTMFDPVLDEEARHIVFFVNWVTYLQINRRQGAPVLRAAHSLWYYGRALRHLIEAFGESDTSGAGFTATGASAFAIDLTPQMFIDACLQANARRMSRFDERLLQPQLMSAIAKVALSTLQFFSRLKPRTEQKIRISEQ